MTTKIKSPTYPESVSDGTISNWVKKEGESVKQDELIAEIETDKIVLEVLSPIDGEISKIIKNEGDIVLSGELIAEVEKNNSSPNVSENIKEDIKNIETNISTEKNKSMGHGPAIRRLLDEHKINPEDINGTGKDGRITKTDISNYLNQTMSKEINESEFRPVEDSTREEERVPMSRMRSTIAKRLLSVTQETAMLTTFNEVDMQPIKNLRNEYGEDFKQNHGLKLGFMGFFVAASIIALKKYPIANASIDGNEVVYHGYQDISVAVSTDKGLVVPVIRDADMMTLPEIEKIIIEFSSKAQEGKLSIEEMQGGTFTISNGGVFGSLLSTPILNAPQTAILGMHKIQDRPVVVDGKIEIRPMMYLALSYDHRLLDGKDAVSFLISIKEQLEKPERLLLNL
jgi:2-oxoglutarate dehydrogenase E2 component (dihydrolipoamide succinyltransferase)